MMTYKESNRSSGFRPTADARAAKGELRERFRRFRRGLDEAAYRARSQAIVERLAALPELGAARTVHAYWPVVGEREVDVRPLLVALHARGVRVVLPVVRSFERAMGDRLAHALFTGVEALQANKWGILEPSDEQTVPIEEIDLVIVPALGAGRNGHRIGHGFGYYDEFLGRVSVPRVGPLYHECLVEAVAGEAHDVPLTVVVTEHDVVRPEPV